MKSSSANVLPAEKCKPSLLLRHSTSSAVCRPLFAHQVIDRPLRLVGADCTAVAHPVRTFEQSRGPSSVGAPASRRRRAISPSRAWAHSGAVPQHEPQRPHNVTISVGSFQMAMSQSARSEI
jgi:hypothetical protein